MSSAASRAEARRKAILSRGSDRLSKLTSTARGEENPVYINNESQAHRASTTETFIGEETVMPTPTPPTAEQKHPIQTPEPGNAPSAWSQEEQQEFLRALMTSPEISSVPGGQPSSLLGQDFAASAADDPTAAMMSAFTQLTGQTPAGLRASRNLPPGKDQAPRTKTVTAKILPLVHLFATWALLAFFAIFKEPETYSTTVHVDGNDSTLRRWAELTWRKAKGGFGVQPVPFFWAFVALQIALHSIQLFTNTNPLQPPALIDLALPHLPPRLRYVVTNVLTYIRMVGMLLDDFAGLVFGIGVLIWTAAWISGR